MREVSLFFLVFLILITGLAILVHIFGGSFGLSFGDSWFLAAIALTFLVPALANIHISVSPHGTESKSGRILAFIRGFALCLAAVACATPVLTTIHDHSVILWGGGIGLLITIATVPLEFYFDRIRARNQ